jgi:hypothetical protein
MRTFYVVHDGITDQGFSGWLPGTSLSGESSLWDGSFDYDMNGNYTDVVDFHEFETASEALEAVRLFTTEFHNAEPTGEIDFQIFKVQVQSVTRIEYRVTNA